jgi:hypothetical protein
MKKLMITAAAAAMIGSAQAVVCATSKCGDGAAGTAYKVAISLKTTDVKSKTTRLSNCDDPECYYWRQQATKKIDGLIWAGLDDCLGCYTFDPAVSAFWTKDGAVDAEFAIGVGLIGNTVNSKKIEAFGGLNGDEFGALSWAGFGNMAASIKGKTACDDGECLMYPKSITGGIAGYLLGPEWSGVCDDTCEPIIYNGCCEDMQLENTAAYGTIKITYDASTAKKVALAIADGRSVDNPATFFKIPAAAASDIEEVVQEVVIEE